VKNNEVCSLARKGQNRIIQSGQNQGEKKEKEKVKKVEKHRLRVFVGPSQVNFSSDLIHGLHRS
jgi:predicted TIM-barrel enzyme